MQLACRVLEVSESGYYARRSRAPSPRSIRHEWLTDVIRQVHAVSRGTYGIRRVHAELTLGRSITVGHQAVELLMRRAQIQGISGRPKFRHVAGVATAEDRVARQFHRDQADELWVTDVTEHPTREGKVYCAVVLDAWSRRVIGWSIDGRPTTALCDQCARYGNRPAPAEPKHDYSQRPGHTVHFMGVHQASPRLRSAPLNGFGRRLFRQCGHGGVLEPGAGGIARPKTMANARRAGERDLRLPRDIPQSPTSPFVARYADASRVRGSQSANDSGMNPRTRLHRSQDTARPPRNPGRFTLRLLDGVVLRSAVR